VAHELVVQPQAILIGGRFAAGARRAAEQAHAGRRLKNVRGKRAAVHIKFHAQIAGVGNPGYLVAFIDHDNLRNKSNEYGAFSHSLYDPCANPAVTPNLGCVATIAHSAQRILVTFVTEVR